MCELDRKITQSMLGNYDDDLAMGRDRTWYQDKDGRTTITKWYMGKRHTPGVYMRPVRKIEKGPMFTFWMKPSNIDKIGLFSTNLVEKISMIATEAPYCVTAEMISSTFGQSISHEGAWNLIQRLGVQINEGEKHLATQMDFGI